MKNIKHLITLLVPGLFALLMSGNAAACDPIDPGCPTGSTAESWNFATGSYTGNGASWGSGLTFIGSNGTSVTATGWSNSNYANATSDSNYGTGNLVSREIVRYDGNGLGVTSPNDIWQDGSHAVDNKNNIDSVLLNFGNTSVSLSQIKFGWTTSDSDFSLAYYKGSGTPDLASMGYGDLASNGWTVVGSYLNYVYNGSTDPTLTDVNDGDISSYWLISALNPDLGGPTNLNYYGNDYFKLGAVEGCELPGPPPSTVPEPSTLLLLGCVALISLLRGRTQKGGQCSIAA